MRTINEQLKIIKSSKRIGLMTHVVAGYPSLEESIELVLMMERAGVDLVEVQLPFSDPIADGPAIMMANDRALEQGVGVVEAVKMIEQLSQQVEIPLIAMGYYQSVLHYGVAAFCRKMKELGVEAVIIPDIPVDEESNDHFIEICSQNQVSPIRVLSPTSTTDRIQQNLNVADHFIYCTAVAGTTGTRSEVENQTKLFLQSMRQQTALPLAVGFGISQPSHVKSLIGLADIAVVGSAVIKKIEVEGIAHVEEFITSFLIYSHQTDEKHLQPRSSSANY